jgi:hypothetical protein
MLASSAIEDMRVSHHYSGPDVSFPHGDARLDLTDLFAFSKPGGAGKTILIMNVHPSVSLLSQEPTTRVPFASDALYEIKIDTDGDSVANIAYRVRFSPFINGTQTARLRRVEGAEAAGTGDGGEVIVDWAPVSLDRQARVTDVGDYRFFAGWRSDPFFFDPLGAVNNFKFTGKDFFTDKDICSIVLEVPNSALGRQEMGLWARTLDGGSGYLVQADRGGKPSQAVFLAGDARLAYLAAEPVDDARFIPAFAHSLEHTGSFTPEEATRVARNLLPDILRFDPRRPASYPDNGRTLTDDVLDHFLSIITNGKITTDGVGAHSDLLAEFPYVGPPHNAALG